MAATTAAKKKTASSSQSKTPSDKNLSDQLAQAQLALEKNAFVASQLHSSWHSYLFRLGFFVCLVCLHQAHGSIGQCVQDVKQYNENAGDVISSQRTARLVMQDSLEYILALCAAISLLVSLKSRHVYDFFSVSWLAATTFAAAAIAIYTLRMHPAETSCVHSVDPSTSFENDTSRNTKSFPLSVAFHIIATVCVGFMRTHQGIQQREMLALQQLKQNLMNSKKKR